MPGCTAIDGINSNGILTRGELETGLGGRPDFDHFAGWLFANGAKKWRKYDVDKSGTINVDELREIVREYCEEAEEIREKAANALDVVMKAITVIAKKTGKEMGTSLWFHLFKQFDTDGTGRISKDELIELIRKTLKIPVKALTDVEIGHLWVAIEVDGDGTLEVEEFANFMDGNWVGKPEAVELQFASSSGTLTRRKSYGPPSIDEFEEAEKSLVGGEWIGLRNAVLINRVSPQVPRKSRK